LTHDRNAFDHIRLMAAALVLFSHHFALLGLPEPGAIGSTIGHLGLAIFFALSGYLVAKSFSADAHVGRFFMRRALRIMPGLIVNVIVCVVFFGALLTTIPLGDYFQHPTTWAYFKNILLSPTFQLPGVLETAIFPYAVNGSLWTLPFEVAAYVVLVIVGAMFRNHLRWLSPCFVVLGMLVELWWHPVSPIVVWGNDWRFAPLFFTYFFTGVALSFFAPLLLTSSRMTLLLALYILIEQPTFRTVAAILIIACMSIYLGRQVVSRQFELKNDCSYGMYLYAFPVQQLVIAKFSALGFWPTLAIAALLTYVFAFLSWKLVERPMLKLKPANRPLAK
jgi:peptidoglycan/LPS O-acetylase OafA/YrhL